MSLNLVSDNCTGYFYYRHHNKEYNHPLITNSIKPIKFIEFVKNIEKYLNDINVKYENHHVVWNDGMKIFFPHGNCGSWIKRAKRWKKLKPKLTFYLNILSRYTELLENIEYLKYLISNEDFIIITKKEIKEKLENLGEIKCRLIEYDLEPLFGHSDLYFSKQISLL
jgi:hypothetical protein